MPSKPLGHFNWIFSQLTEVFTINIHHPKIPNHYEPQIFQQQNSQFENSTNTFFYKKPIYKKPRATEAEKLRNQRAALLDPNKLFYCETENRLLFFNFYRKIIKKGHKFRN